MRLIDRLNLSGEDSVLRLPPPWCLLPPAPGVIPTAGHAQLAAQPLDGETSAELLNQVKPFGDSCSFAK